MSLDTSSVPLLEGAQECAAAGYLSSLHPENARVAAAVQGGVGGVDPTTFALLVDPQTGERCVQVGMTGSREVLA